MQAQSAKPDGNDYPDWHYQPLRLLKNEMDNPMEVIKEFFWGYPLPQARKHLKEMLEDAMCNVEVYAINYLTIYDDIEKLVEAAWLVLQQQKEREQESAIITQGQDEILASILKLLTIAIQPERIFLLSWQPAALVDLLIVIPDTATKPSSKPSSTISPSFASLIRSNALKQHLEDGHLFYLSACTEEKQVYSSRPLNLPQPSPAKREEARMIATEQFTSGTSRAAVFFESAKTFFEEKNNSMALFMLHQAAELTFRSLITLLTGCEVKEHHIAVLKKHTRRCAPDLNKVFPADTEEEKRLLSLLDSAYLKARYTDNFSPETNDVLLLLERVQQLQTAAQDTFGEVMEALNEKQVPPFSTDL